MVPRRHRSDRFLSASARRLPTRWQTRLHERRLNNTVARGAGDTLARGDEVIAIPFYPVTLKCSRWLTICLNGSCFNKYTIMAPRVGLCPCEVSSFFKAREKTLFALSKVTSAWCLADLRTKLRSVYRSQFSRNVRALL